MSSANTKSGTTNTDDTSVDSVPQLDSIAVVPPIEAISDALGHIPELAANEKDLDPFTTPRSSQVAESSQEPYSNRHIVGRGADNHVMSWANFNSMGDRNALSRLSQPHAVPDGNVWGNMSPSKRRLDS